MPTYQYRCTECGRDLEAVQKFSDPALTECTTCGGSLRKVFNAVGVVFKGSGFYRTDSRAGASAAAKGAAGSGAAGSGEGGEKAESTKTPSEKSGESSGKPAEKVAASAGNGSASSSGKQPAPAGSTPRSD